MSSKTVNLKSAKKSQAKRTQDQGKPAKQEFDPTKAYRWETDAIISFTGKEFDVIQSAIGAFVGHPITAASIIQLVNASSVLREKIKEYVENGVMTPVEQD